LEEHNKNELLSKEASKEIREGLQLDPEAIVLGYIANLEPRKGHIYAIQMMRRLIRDYPKAILLCAGEGEYRLKLESEIYSLGLQNNVKLLGYRTDIPRILSILDVKIFTSLWEGLPQALVQAALMGIPIVAFDVDCVSEIVHDSKNGYLVPVRDVDGLLEKVKLILSAPEHRQEMGAEGHKIIDDSWGIAQMVRKTDETYSHMIFLKNPSLPPIFNGPH
jgi:glycosyltransferase involved in cell wall biosynthesis